MAVRTRQQGFTLIEILVVLVVIAMMTGILVFGFEQSLDRRRDAPAETLYQWLTAAADIAVLQTTLVGVAEQENHLVLLAFYQDDWFRLADQEPLKLDANTTLIWAETRLSRTEFGLDRDADGERLEPYIVLTPSGEILPAGQLSIVRDQAPIAIIEWDERSQFSMRRPLL